MITIDGSQGEGGGQILRSSLALSLITGQPFRMVNVRARRSRPGLQPQHLMSVLAAAEIGNAKVTGANLQSQNLTFEPGEVKAGEYHFRINTAGATSLVLHTVYLPLALTGQDSKVIVEGGTHVPHSPSYHFLQTTWAAYLRLVGLEIGVNMIRAGFYPRGGGRIEAEIKGTTRKQLRSVRIEELTTPRTVEGIASVAGLPEDIAERMASRVAERIKKKKVDLEIHQETWPGGPGAVMAVVIPSEPAPTLFFGIGERGKRAEAVADEVVDQVLAFLGQKHPAVDAHSADQLLLPLAVAHGPSAFFTMEVTRHLTTNIEVIRAFLDRPIDLLGTEGERGQVQLADAKMAIAAATIDK